MLQKAKCNKSQCTWGKNVSRSAKIKQEMKNKLYDDYGNID